jgi:glycerol kinase
MQFQADVLGKSVRRPANTESTALGAAYLAGLATGYWKDCGEIIENGNVTRIFEPDMTEQVRAELLNGWKKAVKCSFGWAAE